MVAADRESPEVLVSDLTTGHRLVIRLPEPTGIGTFGPTGSLYTAHADAGIIEWDPATGLQRRRYAPPTQ